MGSKRAIPTEQLEMMADGRRHSRAVNAYLAALEAPAPSPAMVAHLERLEAAAVRALEGARSPVKRLLALERLEGARAAAAGARAERERFEVLEAAFLEHAAEYGRRQGLSWSTWRRAGVPAAVLEAAGIGR